MSAPKLCALGLLMACALLCRCASRASYLKNPWSSLDARYVSWEPTTDAVPTVDDRKLALEYLETSLRLWKGAAYGSYIYARVRQTSDREVELTAFQVIEGRVAQRSLVRINPEDLTSSVLNNHVHRTSVWHEAERSLGTHRDGFPLATLDQLYESCRRDVLSTHPELPVRMHFDRSGFLQHCGFAPQDCDDCGTISVQTVAKYDMPPEWDLRRNLCVNYDGLAATRTGPDWDGGCQSCSCFSGSEPPKPPPPEPPTDPTAAGGEGLVDICKIDPTACPDPQPLDGPWGRWGFWMCKTLLMADCPLGIVPRDVRAPICVGKATPTESWKIAQDRCARWERKARAP